MDFLFWTIIRIYFLIWIFKRSNHHFGWRVVEGVLKLHLNSSFRPTNRFKEVGYDEKLVCKKLGRRNHSCSRCPSLTRFFMLIYELNCSFYLQVNNKTIFHLLVRSFITDHVLPIVRF